MPASIAQAHSKNMGYLGQLGQSKSSYEGVKFSATQDAVIDVVAQFVVDAVENLDKVKRTASGSLHDSIQPTKLTVNGSMITMGVEVNDYYTYVDKGVKGVEGGRGEYSFKNKFVGRKMLDGIKQWVNDEQAKGKIKLKPVYKREKGRQKIQGKDADSLAWAIAKSVKKKGIKPSKFWTKAVQNLEKNIDDKFTKAVKVDIINAL